VGCGSSGSGSTSSGGSGGSTTIPAGGSGGAGASAESGGNGGNGGSGGSAYQPKTDPHVSGSYEQWQTLSFAFDGPSASESDSEPNPFLDYRLQVELSGPGGVSYTVPGFFDGDGDGGESGDQWRARFVPNTEGEWSYVVSFVEGDDVAISLDDAIGSALSPDGTSGVFDVLPPAADASGFHSRGRVVYSGDHYLRTEDGALWIKGGADSPENFLGYAGFDNTIDQPGGASTNGMADGVHRYPSHEADWQSGDPDWGDGNGKAIIGALNYLASEHVNSIYFLPCNLGGDGRETYPYVDPSDLLHFDISKLRQWEIVFAHAEQLGIALHFVLSETESGNENLHDGGTLGNERKLFYREFVARFGHHQGLFWNIGEENDYSSTEQISFAGYLRAVDPYDSPTTVHTHANNPAGQYNGLLGEAAFELTSIQYSSNNTNDFTEQWRANSAATSKPWVVMLDEIAPAGTGVTDSNAAQIRQQSLWPAYLSGAGGVEWYFGYHSLPLGGDMRCEDFRTRQDMWRYTWFARQFIQALPLAEMAPDDSLLGTSGQVFYATGKIYALYLPNGGETTLDLQAETGTFSLRWYDVTTGNYSSASDVSAGSIVQLGAPAFAGDVAAVLEQKGAP